jgi:hypothetical protein
MPKADQTEIRLRLVIEKPVPGVMLSLQDKASKPVNALTPGKADVSFEFSIRVGPDPKGEGWKFYGEHVRSEGPTRRFFYIGVGAGAGQTGTHWSRRMKIDIHDIPPALIEKAVKGKVLEAHIAGTGKDGTPACASVPLLKAWKAV